MCIVGCLCPSNWGALSPRSFSLEKAGSRRLAIVSGATPTPSSAPSQNNSTCHITKSHSWDPYTNLFIYCLSVPGCLHVPARVCVYVFGLCLPPTNSYQGPLPTYYYTGASTHSLLPGASAHSLLPGASAHSLLPGASAHSLLQGTSVPSLLQGGLHPFLIARDLRPLIITRGLRASTPYYMGAPPIYTTRGFHPLITTRGLHPLITTRGLRPLITTRCLLPLTTARGLRPLIIILI